jgi:hypothetical protein
LSYYLLFLFPQKKTPEAASRKGKFIPSSASEFEHTGWTTVGTVLYYTHAPSSLKKGGFPSLFPEVLVADNSHCSVPFQALSSAKGSCFAQIYAPFIEAAYIQ